MKKATVAWLIAAAVFVVLGSVLFVGVLAANHWTFSAIGTRYETNTIPVVEPFRNLSIQSDTADIAFLRSDDGTCKAVFHEHPKIRHTAVVQDGTLVITAVDTREWFEMIGISFDSPNITVYLPEQNYGDLVIDEHTGKITIPKDFTFANIFATASTGDVACFAQAEQTMQIKTSTGDIRVQGVAVGELVLSVTTGKVIADSVESKGDVRVNVSTGRAELKDVACENLISAGSTGGIRLTNVLANGSISMERSTGNVQLDQCDAAELTFRTDTGKVTGSLRSEKVFAVKSDTGRVEAPETTSGGLCKITTDTGNIRITISQPGEP